jgi:hypothetical protein
MSNNWVELLAVPTPLSHLRIRRVGHDRRRLGERPAVTVVEIVVSKNVIGARSVPSVGRAIESRKKPASHPDQAAEPL